MGRPKRKPEYNSEKIMEQFTNCIAEAYMSGAGDGSANSLRQISEQFSITLMKTRKILITAGAYHTELSDQVISLKGNGKSISEIMDEAEYPGIRVSMTTTFDGVVTPLKIDISTGDAITPREVRYSFKLMLEDRSIDIWAYNLETVLAEKLETIITRTTTNTRMRDFYDIYILDQLHGNTLNRQTLHDALRATAHKRGTEQHLAEAAEVFEEVENSPVMQKLWESYRKKFSYAADLEWNIIMGAVRSLYALSEKESSL